MPLWTPSVRLETLGMPIREAIDFAARAGLRGVEFDAVGDLSPDELSHTGRRQLRHLLQSRGLQAVAIGLPTRRGYDTAERLEARIALALKTLQFAYEMGAGSVIQAIGAVPEKLDDPAAAPFVDALQRIGHEGLRVGARLAIHTASETPERLKQLLELLNNHGLAVAFDVGKVFARVGNPYDSAVLLHQSIATIQIKDAVRTGTTVSGFEEVPIGEGEIDWQRFLAVLEEIGFRGPCILDRDHGRLTGDQIGRALSILTPIG